MCSEAFARTLCALCVACLFCIRLCARRPRTHAICCLIGAGFITLQKRRSALGGTPGPPFWGPGWGSLRSPHSLGKTHLISVLLISSYLISSHDPRHPPKVLTRTISDSCMHFFGDLGGLFGPGQRGEKQLFGPRHSPKVLSVTKQVHTRTMSDSCMHFLATWEAKGIISALGREAKRHLWGSRECV